MNKTHSQEKAAEQALKFLEKKKVKNKSFRKPPRGSALNVIKKRSTMELVNERFSNTSKKLTDDKLFEKSSKQSHSLDSSHNNDSILKNSLKATENSVLEESKNFGSLYLFRSFILNFCSANFNTKRVKGFPLSSRTAYSA